MTKNNANADVAKLQLPPTHVFGLAFDIGRVGMPVEEDLKLESILREWESAGKIVYFKEGASQAAYHVVALPRSFEEFREYELIVQATMAEVRQNGNCKLCIR